MKMTRAERRGEALLLDQDLKSGKLSFDKGMARVAEAAGEALAAGARAGALKIKGNKGAKSGVASVSAEAAVEKFEKECAGLIDPKKVAKGQPGGGGGGDGTISSAFGFSLFGGGALQILPVDEEFKIDGLEGKS